MTESPEQPEANSEPLSSAPGSESDDPSIDVADSAAPDRIVIANDEPDPENTLTFEDRQERS